MNLRKALLGAAAVAACAAAALSLTAAPPRDEQLPPSQKLRFAEMLIENYYVDSVAPDSIVTEAIVAMLKTLDPHSSYTSPKETEELTQPLDGKFSGIGVQFSIVRDTVCVVQTTAGGPSQRLGILPGDRILYVNDTLFTHPKMANSEVLKSLRGPKGSVVNLKVKRGGENELIDFRIVRDDIPIYSVDNVYMVTPEVGFISVSRFAEDTPDEVDKAISKLRARGMKHLIIDLQSNGGGYLGAAHGLASRFLKPGDVTVSTSGRAVPDTRLTVDKAYNTGVERLVVMVDQFSASAAEIFAGAMQDYDRGVVVGRRTFGKGLVQRPFPFPDGSMIRLTTSRYYTPSGRSIQKPYAKGHGEEYQLDMLNRLSHGELWSADSMKIDSTLEYRTLRNGRVVYGGGGIVPDRFVPLDTTNNTRFQRDIVAKGILNRFVTDRLDKNRPALLARYPDNDTFCLTYDIEPDYNQLIETARAEGLEPTDEDLERSGRLIAAMLKGLMARDLYPDGTYMQCVNPLNPVFNQALDLILDPEAYNRLLQP